MDSTKNSSNSLKELYYAFVDKPRLAYIGVENLFNLKEMDEFDELLFNSKLNNSRGWNFGMVTKSNDGVKNIVTSKKSEGILLPSGVREYSY